MWRKKQETDFFYKKAKKDGFRSRAAYKLLEMQQKFKVIKPNSSVLDLGCAPGGWLQVAREMTNNFVCGIDLQAIEPIDGVHFAQLDCFDELGLIKFFKESGAPNKFDVILSDMAPNISGDHHADHAHSMELFGLFYTICMNFLTNSGMAVVKVFEGKYLESTIQSVQGNVSRFKPKSSRAESSELYLIITLNP